MTRNTGYNLEDMGISISALLYNGLKKWRVILIAALVGCLVGAGAQTFLSGRNAEQKLAKHELEVQQYHASVESNTRIAEDNEALLQERMDYLQNSVWINLDSDHVWEASLAFALNLEEEELGLYSNTAMNPFSQVAGSYLVELSGKSLPAEDRLSLIGTENPAYWDELVKVGMEGSARLVTIVCKGESEEFVTRMASYLTDRMTGKAQTAVQAILPHTCTLYSQTVNEKTDEEITSRRQAISDKLASYREAARTARANLEKLEKDGEPGMPGNRIAMMAVVIAFVFALLAFVLVDLKCVFGWVVDHEDIVRLYDAPKLGRVHLKREKQIFVDRWVDWLFFRHRPDADSELEGIASYLRQKAPEGKVMLCGTAPEKDIRRVCDGISAHTGKAPAVEAVMSLSRNTSRLEEAGKSAGVVIVEKLGTSRTKSVVDEADKLVVNGVPVLGWVLIDG